jgi:hypothetical protein
MLCHVVSQKFTDASDTINMIMEAVSVSETSISFYETAWRNIPEESHLHTRRYENLKTHLKLIVSVS